MKGFKLGLDSRSREIIHIDQVIEGFKYGICPECKSGLIASNRNQGTRKNDTYFRHKVDSNCQGETLIHLWAKQVIADKKKVRGAEYIAIGKAKDLARKFHRVELKHEAETLSLTRVELEQRLTNEKQARIPDLMCDVVDGSVLAAEIFVNSAVTDRKASFFVEQQLDCLEIDLSNMPSHFLESPEVFEQYVINDAPRTWIYCSRYTELETQALEDAKEIARLASEIINARRNKTRSLKSLWRETHSDFVKLVDAYVKPDNQLIVESLYQAQLEKTGSLSNSYKSWFCSHFGGMPDILNIPLKGDLGFKCHRSVWQWEVYQRVVLYSYIKSKKAFNKPIRTTRAMRGYEDSARLLAWYENAPKWSPEDLYNSIKDIVPLTKICLEAERIAGEPLTTEKDKPESFAGLKVKEWREIPKPVCVIRRYIKKLVSQSILEVFEGDTYVVPQNVKLPVFYDCSSLKLETQRVRR